MHHDHDHRRHDKHPHRHGTSTARRTNGIVRSRYFYSMLLEEPDLTVEQSFHLGNLRRHTAEMHGFGTVCGLRVVETDCHEEVVLRAGVAVDCLGREIRVDCDVKIDLREAVAQAVAARAGESGQYKEPGCRPEPVDVYVSLCYDEVEERPVQAIGGPETPCTPGCQMSRTRSGFIVQVGLTRPAVPEKLRDVIEDLRQCDHERLREWICDWITDPCWACAPDPCGKDHACVGLAHVRVIPGGAVLDIDNCCVRPLVLPNVLLGQLVAFAVNHARRTR